MQRMTASVPFGPGLDTSMPIAADPPLHAHWRFTATSDCIRRPSASVFAHLARRSTFSRLGSKKSHRAVQTPEGKPVRNWSGSESFFMLLYVSCFRLSSPHRPTAPRDSVHELYLLPTPDADAALPLQDQTALSQVPFQLKMPLPLSKILVCEHGELVMQTLHFHDRTALGSANTVLRAWGAERPDSTLLRKANLVP